jgi:type IV pilus assembly protein PilV
MKKRIINKVIKRIKIKGSMLLEAMIGILIFSFGVMGLALFQGVSMANNFENTLRAEASMYVNELIGQMWANSDNLDSFIANDEEIPRTESRLLEPRKTVTINGNEATIELSWKRPNDEKRASITVTTKITPNG